MKNKYYVYIYLDPRKQGSFQYGALHFDYEPFYIGKGFGLRMYAHIRNSNLLDKVNPHKVNKINKIINSGFNIRDFIIKLYDNVSDEESKEKEMYAIRIIGRYDLGLGPLTNLTDGGEGSVNYRPTPETTAKIVAKAIGNKSRTGQIFSKEEIEKHRIAMLGNKRWKGKDYENTKIKQSFVKRKLNNEQASEIINKYYVLKSHTQQQLAEEYNVSRSLIKRILHNQLRTFTPPKNIDTSKRRQLTEKSILGMCKFNQSDKIDIFNMWNNNIPYKEIMNRYNISSSQIWRITHKLKICRG